MHEPDINTRKAYLKKIYSALTTLAQKHTTDELKEMAMKAEYDCCQKSVCGAEYVNAIFGVIQQIEGKTPEREIQSSVGIGSNCEGNNNYGLSLNKSNGIYKGGHQNNLNETNSNYGGGYGYNAKSNNGSYNNQVFYSNTKPKVQNQKDPSMFYINYNSNATGGYYNGNTIKNGQNEFTPSINRINMNNVSSRTNVSFISSNMSRDIGSQSIDTQQNINGRYINENVKKINNAVEANTMNGGMNNFIGFEGLTRKNMNGFNLCNTNNVSAGNKVDYMCMRSNNNKPNNEEISATKNAYVSKTNCFLQNDSMIRGTNKSNINEGVNNRWMGVNRKSENNEHINTAAGVNNSWYGVNNTDSVINMQSVNKNRNLNNANGSNNWTGNNNITINNNPNVSNGWINTNNNLSLSNVSNRWGGINRSVGVNTNFNGCINNNNGTGINRRLDMDRNGIKNDVISNNYTITNKESGIKNNDLIGVTTNGYNFLNGGMSIKNNDSNGNLDNSRIGINKGLDKNVTVFNNDNIKVNLNKKKFDGFIDIDCDTNKDNDHYTIKNDNNLTNRNPLYNTMDKKINLNGVVNESVDNNCIKQLFGGKTFTSINSKGGDREAKNEYFNNKSSCLGENNMDIFKTEIYKTTTPIKMQEENRNIKEWAETSREDVLINDDFNSLKSIAIEEDEKKELLKLIEETSLELEVFNEKINTCRELKGNEALIRKFEVAIKVVSAQCEAIKTNQFFMNLILFKIAVDKSKKYSNLIGKEIETLKKKIKFDFNICCDKIKRAFRRKKQENANYYFYVKDF